MTSPIFEVHYCPNRKHSVLKQRAIKTARSLVAACTRRTAAQPAVMSPKKRQRCRMRPEQRCGCWKGSRLIKAR